MYMKHKESKGVAECNEDTFNLLHKNNGWEEATAEEFEAYELRQQTEEVAPEAVLVDDAAAEATAEAEVHTRGRRG